MMQLVAQAGHFHAAEDVRIGFGAGIDVDDRDRVRLLPGRIECGHIGEFFSRRLHGHARRRIKARIGSPSHGILPNVLGLLFIANLPLQVKQDANDQAPPDVKAQGQNKQKEQIQTKPRETYARKVADCLQRKLIIESHFAGRKSLM